PTLLQALGFLPINNLLGLCLVVLLAARIIETRDFSFLRIRQIRILIVIGLLLLLGTYMAEVQFPMLQATVGQTKILDKTSNMGHDFITRLVYLIFFAVFVRGRSDVRIMCLVFMLGLYAAIPSALANWWQGTLNRGFRVEASLTSGSNPNRLGMICLIQMILWWFWAQTRPGMLRQLIAFGAIGSAGLGLVPPRSRDGLVGSGFPAVLAPARRDGVPAAGGPGRAVRRPRRDRDHRHRAGGDLAAHVHADAREGPDRRNVERDARGDPGARLAGGAGLSRLRRRPRQLPRGDPPDLQ